MYNLDLTKNQKNQSVFKIELLLKDLSGSNKLAPVSCFTYLLFILIAFRSGEEETSLEIVFQLAVFGMFMLLIGFRLEKQLKSLSFMFLIIANYVIGQIFLYIYKSGVKLHCSSAWFSIFAIYWADIFQSFDSQADKPVGFTTDLDESVSSFGFASIQRQTKTVYTADFTDEIMGSQIQSSSLKIRIYKALLLSYTVYRGEQTYFWLFILGVGIAFIHIRYYHHSISKLFNKINYSPENLQVFQIK